MRHLNHNAFVNACRDERGVSHHTLRAYAQDLRTFARFVQANQIQNPFSREDIVAYHRHLRDAIEAKPATIERRLSTLRSYFAWREDRNAALPSPFADLRISVRIPRRLPRPVDASESAFCGNGTDLPFVGIHPSSNRARNDGRCYDPDRQATHRDGSPH